MSALESSPYPSSHPPLTIADLTYLRLCFSTKRGLAKSPLHSAFRVFAIITFTLPNSANTEDQHQHQPQSQPAVTDSDHPYYSHGYSRYHHSPLPPFPRSSVLPPFIQRLPAPLSHVHGPNSSPVYYLTGCNVEVCHTGCGFCAERSALSLLRQVDYQRILSVYIVSDLDSELEPGLLCREFLYQFIHPQTPIFLASMPKSVQIPSDLISSSALASSGSAGSVVASEPLEFTYKTVYLQDLYPYPPLILHVSAPFVAQWAQEFASKSTYQAFSTVFGSSVSAADFPRLKALPESISSSQRLQSLYSEATQFTKHDDRTWINPIQFACVVAFSDGSSALFHQTKLAEYGYSLDPITKSVGEIERRKRESGGSVLPVLIIQVDPSGILHPPFAPARAHLTEAGDGECLVIIHNRDGKLIEVSFDELVPGNVNSELKTALEQPKNS